MLDARFPKDTVLNVPGIATFARLGMARQMSVNEDMIDDI